MATTRADKVPQNQSRRGYKTPLSDIDFITASNIIQYAETMRLVGRTEQLELHTAADELEAILSHSTGNFYERAVARRKARKVANILRKAADQSRALAVEGVRLRRRFMTEYDEILHPRNEHKRGLDWKS